MSSPTANSSLRPAWHRASQSGGRGFQPPPAVASERVREQPKQTNKFAALDDEDDIIANAAVSLDHRPDDTTSSKRTANSRSEGLRTSSARSSSGRPGRSLADLAARVPDRERSASFGSAGDRSNSSGGGGGGSRLSAYVNDSNVIRFTREKLLSMRPRPTGERPEEIQKLDEHASVLIAEAAQDPVCWDTFDAEAIWATVPARRQSSKAVEGMPEVRRTSSRREAGSTSGRWQRGVALPPPDQAKSNKSKEAENPSDLWDDPQATGAAADFSAFGAMPEDDNEPFDFEKMAEATAKFEEELHGNRSRASSEADSDGNDDAAQTRKIDSHRPLASVGTTIQSGSGDNVNVFEDFGDPTAENAVDAGNGETAAIKSGDEDQNASSRLMAMIGVKREPVPSQVASEPSTTEAWGAPADPPKPVEDSAAAVPLNPWGGPLLPGQGAAQNDFDIQARMREAEALKARQQEEAKRRAAAQQEAEARKATSTQQSDGVQSQVELVLMERISTILENSWGQSDLASILSTLHAEDSRVIPLLSNTDALRALILRNPQRIALRSNPVFGTEMAALLLTNTQWQQKQQQQQAAQQQAALRSQHEELQRRQAQQLQLQQQQEKASAVPVVADGLPWYYSDPQNNIQGPFRGEEMRQWLEAGYFKADLPISQQNTGPFFPLSKLFPDLTVAFAPNNLAATEEIEKNARTEAEQHAAAEVARKEEDRRARVAAERERVAREAVEREKQAQEAAKREQRAHEKAERERAAQEAQRRAREEAAAGQEVNESSNQLKMMLGVGVSSGSEEAMEKRSSMNSNQQPKANERSKSVQAKPSAPAWGGASKPVSRKSMSEIQKEEARAAAIAAMNREGGRSSSGGWANIAASRGGSGGWQGGAAQQRPAAVIQKQQAVPAGTQSGVSQGQIAQVAASNAQLSARPQGSQSSTAAEDFGAKMSPALEKWCKEQMLKLNGTDDLTLVSFCMTLSDPIEIRQYLTTYLGSGPQVNSFATEFINKKSGANAPDEWETTAVAKKSRKKKSGGR